MLVVDDNVGAREAIVAMLEDLGVDDVRTANDGRQALDSLKERAEDTVLLDLMMPVMDGYEVLNELRGQSSQARPTRLIVMSAHEPISGKSTILALGADDFLCKPFSLAELENVIGR